MSEAEIWQNNILFYQKSTPALRKKRVNSKTKLKLLKKLPKPTAMVKVKLKDGSEGLEPSHISLPQPDGSQAPIPTKEVSEATEILGVLFAMVGNGLPHMEMMKDKGLT